MRPPAATWRLYVPLLAAFTLVAAFFIHSLKPDEQLRRRLRARLEADPATANLSLDVHAASGVATVSGGIADRAQQARVLAIVSRTDGVLDVIDDLTISDRVITQKVLDAFRAAPEIASVPVAVISIDGEVTLRSDQTNATQRRQMVQLASTVDGVTHVVDAMK